MYVGSLINEGEAVRRLSTTGVIASPGFKFESLMIPKSQEPQKNSVSQNVSIDTVKQYAK